MRMHTLVPCRARRMFDMVNLDGEEGTNECQRFRQLKQYFVCLIICFLLFDQTTPF